MSLIVREHYPVSALPEDLRDGLPDHGWVRVSVEMEAPDHEIAEGSEDLTLEQIFALAASGPRRSADEIDADLRASRDEWDERV